MPYCSNCGTKLSDGANFCPNCGNAVGFRSQKIQQQEPAYGVHLREDGMREKSQGTIQMDRMKGLSMSKHLHKTSMYMQGKVRGLQ